jgi:hypothetical protein
MKRQACSSNERLSKETFLSILGYPPYQRENINLYGNTTFYFYKGEKITIPASDELYSTNLTRAYFEKLDYENTPWSIRSFDSKTREVCVEINTKSGLREISVTLPNIISKEE